MKWKKKMTQIQLDFLKTPEQQEIEALKHCVEQVNISVHKVRKKLFSVHGTDRKLLLELDERLKIIEKYICKT